MSTTYDLEPIESSPFSEGDPSRAVPSVDGFAAFDSFRGQLDQIGLPSLLCIFAMDRKTGILVLVVEPEMDKAFLHLNEGRVFRAHREGAEEPRNAELVYGLLACARGTFDFRPSNVDLDDDVQCSTTRLIIEGARRIDEANVAPGSETVEIVSLRMDGLEATPLEKHVSADDPPAPGLSGYEEKTTVALNPPMPGQGLTGKNSRWKKVSLRRSRDHEKRRAVPDLLRRWTPAKAAVAALLMASFALVVMTASFRTHPAVYDSVSRMPVEPSSP